MVDDPEQFILAIRDELGNMEHFYNEATAHMLQAFKHLRKASELMKANGVYAGEDYKKIVGLAMGNLNNARGEFYRKHRRDSWMQVFGKAQFHKWLDKAQTEQFLRDVEREATIPFTADNIKGTLENIILQRARLFEQSVANVFDELTRYYKGNTEHSEGWKSNDNYRVNEKLVFPWGCRFDRMFRRFERMWSYNTPIDVYNDLDRVLCVLDGKQWDVCRTIGKAMEEAFERLGRLDSTGHFNNTAESEYFDIRFWMKGTVHLKWKRKDLLEKFNVKAAAGKRWIGRNTQGEEI